MQITRSRLRFFAKATGQTDPIYTDVEAAQQAGHPDLPVPPTFLFGVDFETEDPFAWYAELEIDLRTVLHGGQDFSYHRLVHAGETITAHPQLRKTYDKRGGALIFLERVITYRDGEGETVAEATTTVIIPSQHTVEEAL